MSLVLDGSDDFLGPPVDILGEGAIEGNVHLGVAALLHLVSVEHLSNLFGVLFK